MSQACILAHFNHTSAVPNLIASEPTLSTIIIGIAIAFGFGAVHALSPGHGKTLVSAYFIGSQGTPQQAVLLGLTITFTHTLSIFILGVIALFASQYVLPEQSYPVLSLVSGLTIGIVGLSLLRKRLHSHSHFHSHSHAHKPTSLSSLVKLGIAGGLIPCPSALVMLLSAVALHQISYGLFLVGGFSLGLASVLVILGVIAIYARQWLERLPQTDQVLQKLSILSAIVIMVIGIGITCVSITTSL
ncbi:MAG: sulfite exporter TauE/SafE family protein [Coleofasciculus sp. C1-SOL-03]|jgi:ABC-type nickel/cobalt efflux system permease component RcnA|uniref:nickel/cobalt transporter n=1 Tax=Coleofasciculus sp. C1-SOL-03 TaxID=3069522 RepID=UPI003303514F